MLGVWLGNTKLAKEHPEEFLKLGLKLTMDCLSDFIEWTCSFNGTLDIEAYWEQIKNSIGIK